MPIDLVTVGFGERFKPAENMGAMAFLVEPKTAEQLPSKDKPDETWTRVTGDIAIFANEDSIRTDQVRVMQNTSWGGKYLAGDAEPHLGKAFIARIVPTSNGRGYKWENIVDRSIVDPIVAWANARDEQESAEAEDAPDF